ncbi:hypothetical protein RHGRI_004014 [Rhododendron griersonianum]|uniref:Disease resistance N-terminal domain-containing protein n=1 Tax=Rhododendron griersonianum TaxID=479676 RepID=A0AAV6L819_9ERIC|nr:hypothetical protein RHGRI_004014 [Rhododendron griersonianum]
MSDIDVDFFLKTLKQLTTNSNLDFVIDEKHQLQFLEEEIKYLRGFLKSTEKKRNEHLEVMKLVKQIRDVVSEAENIVELFVSHAFKADVSQLQNYKKKKNKKKKKKKIEAIREHQKHLSLDLKSVKGEIKTLTAEVKKIYDQNMYDIIME